MGEKTQNFSFAITLSTLTFLGLVGSACALTQTSSGVQMLNVLVFNYSEAPPALLSNAEREASRIFGLSGIHFAWTHCPPLASPDSPSRCTGEPAASEIRVRVLGRHLNYNFQGSVFGFAIAPTLASVYYESALHLAQTTTTSESEVSVILGCLIAHEIGHLLLGSNHHTVNGIMQARWDIPQIQRATKGTLGFTPEQSKLIQVNAHMRTNPCGAFVSAQLSNAPIR